MYQNKEFVHQVGKKDYQKQVVRIIVPFTKELY